MLMHSDGKFPEIFTGANIPETFPTMLAHRFYLFIFYRIIYVSGKFPEIFITTDAVTLAKKGFIIPAAGIRKTLMRRMEVEHLIIKPEGPSFQVYINLMMGLVQFADR
jgi:hypothetical protein